MQRLASVGQRQLAAHLNVSESTVSRMKEGDIQRFSQILGFMGLKVVPESAQCYPNEYVEKLHYFANIGMHIDPDEAMKIKGLAWD